MAPRAIGQDIPMARRTVRQGAPRKSLANRLARFVGGTALASLGVALLVMGPLRHLIVPPPVQGLNERLGADGRLLGHFPYPEVQSNKLTNLAPGVQLRSEAADAFDRLQRAAAADGINLVVLSAFRPVSLQRRLFFDVMAARNQSSRDRARVSAPPGFSEHSTGFALDVGDGSAPQTNLTPSFDETPAFQWLEANAARYHFVLSFPQGNRQGVSYEPWHWRFEGSTDALKLFEPAQRLAGR